jgi:hypothetical protein
MHISFALAALCLGLCAADAAAGSALTKRNNDASLRPPHTGMQQPPRILRHGSRPTREHRKPATRSE